ncbi:hypothetical protein PPACK8108_LOCUS17882 [Phakopsora pachyrhizi]|uniref:Uncharacterized protein n=1 Tax=Phakopsora pachyrhizi TaxID=170000 RepID=A0AAV0BDQ0_PHAPC|nr:hypothetical protein PPACK8108_LOCUS17882 [Phakopsora pachyrhizi]
MVFPTGKAPWTTERARRAWDLELLTESTQRSFINPSALILSTLHLINSVKRHNPRLNLSSTDRLQSCEETDRRPRGITDFVLNRMHRKLSQQSGSTDFEPQSDLITISLKVGIGTRPVEKTQWTCFG